MTDKLPETPKDVGETIRRLFKNVHDEINEIIADRDWNDDYQSLAVASEELEEVSRRLDEWADSLAMRADDIQTEVSSDDV